MRIDLIVSRHPGAIDWLRQQGITAPVISAAVEADVRGKSVAGNLPLHLAQKARSLFAIEFTGDAPRGTEYTAADMTSAGARLVEYFVMLADEARGYGL